MSTFAKYLKLAVALILLRVLSGFLLVQTKFVAVRCVPHESVKINKYKPAITKHYKYSRWYGKSWIKAKTQAEFHNDFNFIFTRVWGLFVLQRKNVIGRSIFFLFVFCNVEIENSFRILNFKGIRMWIYAISIHL